MNGSLSIEKEAVRWSKTDTDAYLTVGAVGLLAGILVTFARMPLHMPGHKVLWWMTPVLTSRLLTRTKAGAITGALATALSTMLLGGRLAGGIIMMPMVVFAGALLDLTAGIVERSSVTRGRALLWFALAGTVGNLACSMNRLFEPLGGFFSARNINDLLWTAGSYAFFGFLAGLLGAAAGYAISRVRASPKMPQS